MDVSKRLVARTPVCPRPGSCEPSPTSARVPPQTLLTSLLDPVAAPADEIAVLYHERWELELGYDEIKTELL